MRRVPDDDGLDEDGRDDDWLDPDEWLDIRIPNPLSASRELARGEFGGPEDPKARLMAVLLMEVFGVPDILSPEDFIGGLQELESHGILTDLVERRS